MKDVYGDNKIEIVIVIVTNSSHKNSNVLLYNYNQVNLTLI